MLAVVIQSILNAIDSLFAVVWIVVMSFTVYVWLKYFRLSIPIDSHHHCCCCCWCCWFCCFYFSFVLPSGFGSVCLFHCYAGCCYSILFSLLDSSERYLPNPIHFILYEICRFISYSIEPEDKFNIEIQRVFCCCCCLSWRQVCVLWVHPNVMTEKGDRGKKR